MPNRDIKIDFGTFNSTTIEVEPLTQKGREFLADRYPIFFDVAVRSVNLRKSEGFELERLLTGTDITVC